MFLEYEKKKLQQKLQVSLFFADLSREKKIQITLMKRLYCSQIVVKLHRRTKMKLFFLQRGEVISIILTKRVNL